MVVPSTTHKQFVQVVNAHKSVFLQYVHIAGCLAAWLHDWLIATAIADGRK